eukprot:2640958-Pleurochrysis_carterae.AAC.1
MARSSQPKQVSKVKVSPWTLWYSSEKNLKGVKAHCSLRKTKSRLRLGIVATLSARTARLTNQLCEIAAYHLLAVVLHVIEVSIAGSSSGRARRYSAAFLPLEDKHGRGKTCN